MNIRNAKQIVIENLEGMMSSTLRLVVDGKNASCDNDLHNWKAFKLAAENGCEVIDRRILLNGETIDTPFKESMPYKARFA